MLISLCYRAVHSWKCNWCHICATILQVCLEEMSHHIKRFNMFQNTNEFGETLVPTDKMEEMKRRWVWLLNQIWILLGMKQHYF